MSVRRQGTRCPGSAPLVLVLLLVLLVLPAGGSAANLAKTRYSVTLIGNLNVAPGSPACQRESCPQGSGAYGMNNAGDVVGWSYYYPSDGSVYAIMFVFHSGQLTNLRALDGGWGSSGAAINDDRIVVGTAAAATGYFPPYPFSWQNGLMSSLFGGIPACDLPPPAPTSDRCKGAAADINSQGDIVGGRTVPNAVTEQAYVYRSGSFTDLGIAGTATAINDRGEIVGTSGGFVPTGSVCCPQDLVNREGGGKAFLYSHGDLHDLGSLGGALSGANDISDNGKIVGFSDTADGQRHAFLLTKGAGMRDLGTLGGTFSEARAINRSGTIVVGDSTTSTGELHGFVYANGKMVDLNDLIAPAVAGRLIDAQDVNDAGQISGRMAFGSDSDSKGQAVLLTPQ